MNNPERPAAATSEDQPAKGSRIEEPEVEVNPPDREPGVPDMQVINDTPWLGLV